MSQKVEDEGEAEVTISNSTDEIKYDRGHTTYRNNAQKVLNVFVDMTASMEVYHDTIRNIVKTLCPFLLHPDSGRFLQIKPLTGGLSNVIFLVSTFNFTNDNDSSKTGSTVLVRIHPDNKNMKNNIYNNRDQSDNDESNDFSVVDHEQETKFSAWLAKQKHRPTHVVEDEADHQNNNSNKSITCNTHMAPTVYGRFENGRVEEFYHNISPLSCKQMKVYAPWIAQSLASFHQLDAPPIDVLPRPTSDCTATIYESVHAWLKEASKRNKDPINNDENFLTEIICREWIWLEKELANPPQQQIITNDDDGSSSSNNHIVDEALEFIRRVVVTHMDCQPLNILINNNTDNDDNKHVTLRLIDFEYSGWNPIAADIANTFCEYCEMSNLRADYESEYPTIAQQDTFFWNYLLQYDPVRAKKFTSYSNRIRQQQQQSSSNNNIYDDCNDIEWELFLRTCSNEVGRFSLLSHLGWAIWGVVKSQEEDGVDFDYRFYARHRMEGYSWAKKKFIPSK